MQKSYVTFDENIKERNLIIMAIVEITDKSSSFVLAMEQRKRIITVSKPDRRAILVTNYPFLFKWHVTILAKTVLKGDPIATPSI